MNKWITMHINECFWIALCRVEKQMPKADYIPQMWKGFPVSSLNVNALNYEQFATVSTTPY